MKKLSKSVRVTVAERRVKVDLALMMEYGYGIPATCHQVQAKVKAAIENMTGLKCSDVNIHRINIPNVDHLFQFYDFGQNGIYKTAGTLLAVLFCDLHCLVNSQRDAETDETVSGR